MVQFFTFSATGLLALAVASPLTSVGCNYKQKVAAIQHEIDTISSRSFADANQIPLSADASRSFYVTPSELGGNKTLPLINAGFTAETVRAELVGLATVLGAAVPKKSVHYLPEAKNGSVTVDFIQTDRIVLPYEQVREIHYFNDACQITKIIGYVHGPLICPATVSDPVVTQLCAAEAAAAAGK